ncbi:DUF5777 family beta-barrel protein [Bacteroidota bacterium]
MFKKNTIYLLKSKISFLLIACIFVTMSSFAQDATTDSGKKPVRDPWASTLLIDNQTSLMQYSGSLELIIHHRFGEIKDFSDLLGIYAPSNIKMGLNYGVNDWLMVGLGTEKNNKFQELQWKAKILSQNRSGSIPVDIVYYGNIGLDARDEEVFGANYKFTNRLSYFNQLIISRKFTPAFSFQVAPSYMHFNAVDSVMHNDYFGLSAGGRYKIYNEISLLVEYDQGFPIGTMANDEELPKPNFAFGVEFGTSTHCFQVVAASYDNIINQKNYAYNKNDFFDGKIFLGFNITVRF